MTDKERFDAALRVVEAWLGSGQGTMPVAANELITRCLEILKDEMGVYTPVGAAAGDA